MEMLGPILDLVERILPSTCKYYNDHRNVDEYMQLLRDNWKDLEARENDTQSRIKAERPEKKLKEEVKGWLQKVKTIDTQIQALEVEFQKMEFFSRARVGKLASKMSEEVKKHYDKGEFTHGLVIDPPISNGDELPTPPTLRGENTAKRIKEEIWACLFNDNVRKIGVYGMGGSGKSTIMKYINNSLLNETHKFESVIWVTVSKAFNISKLQHDIACKLDLDLSMFDDDDEITRASKLYKALKDKKRYVLILDDLWKDFHLEEVGIPEPTQENGCKLVLTTRLFDVCQKMGCKDFRMELLSKKEAWNWFLDIVGRDVCNIPGLKEIAEEVVEECACLPLAIITIAGSFRGKTDIIDWSNACEELKTMRSGNVENPVIDKLEFSYKHLKDEKLQHCLLYCALYPEDFMIEKRMLVEHLIDEGIIETMESRKELFKKGFYMLNELENACLLEGCINYSNEKCVKMHDLIRDMALKIASPQFIVEPRMRLRDFPDEEKWREDLVKASLMYNNISRIPSNISPWCPKLSTFLLQGNQSLKDVPDSLFVHLQGLKVVDLSDTAIESLPNSVCILNMLTTLRLRGCRKLKHVPSIAKLTKLRKLDLGETGITEVPHGLEMLFNLRYLNLNAWQLKIMPLEILPKLYRLQYFRVLCHSKSVTVKGEEIASLNKLETFGGHFNDMYEFSTFIRSLENRQLVCYEIQVGMSVDGYGPTSEVLGKTVILEDCNLKRGEESFVLPKDVQFLKIVRCHNLKSLRDVPSLNHASELKHIHLNDCEGIEHILCFSSSSSSCTLPQNLEFLELYNLDNLRGLLRKEKATSARVPPDTFSYLKRIFIEDCSIKKLLPPGLLLHLHNLEEIGVRCCDQVEEIIAAASNDFEEEKEVEGMDTTKITLPRLRLLTLDGLPELKTICSSSKVIVCEFLKEIRILNCPKLKRLPLFLPHLNGQLSPPPSLKEILATGECWDLLEWDCYAAKNVLQPFFRVLL